MPYSFLEHTSDIRMKVSGKSLEELFRDALLGMVKIMNPARLRETQNKIRKINIKAPDTTSLLIDFLGETLAWIQSEREAYTKINFQSISEHSLKAKLKGYKTESFGEDIKAVTYHEANVQKNKSGEWSTVIIFDI